MSGRLKDDWGIELTTEQARQVRQWRSEDCTWRVVAHRADVEWGTTWTGNQLFGLALCEQSAHLLGEDPNSEPWN